VHCYQAGDSLVQIFNIRLDCDTGRLLNLIRPSMLFLSIGIAAAGFGLVLHNAALSGLAVGFLILSLARRAPATE
jgi:hypothetical protein